MRVRDCYVNVFIIACAENEGETGSQGAAAAAAAME